MRRLWSNNRETIISEGVRPYSQAREGDLTTLRMGRISHLKEVIGEMASSQEKR